MSMNTDIDVDRPPDIVSEGCDVYFLTRDEVRAGFQRSLDSAGCSWEELDAQARAGRFVSEKARRAWFAASSFVDEL